MNFNSKSTHIHNICKNAKRGTIASFQGASPRLFHITRVGHGLHNAAERIRDNYEDVDKLIAALRASVVKDKGRWAKFAVINSPWNSQSPDAEVDRR